MAFRAIDGDTSWQDLAIAQEIATSYNRRRLVFGLSTISDPTEATRVFDFVQSVQDGIEELMGYDYYGWGAFYGWLLNSAALSTYANQNSEPSPMTLSQGMVAAGLTESGYWRRIAELDTQPSSWDDYDAAGWSYGKISDKDLAGPWLYIDIQMALSALTRCKLMHVQQRRKEAYISYYSGELPSTALTSVGWSDTSLASDFRVGKSKTGSIVTSASSLIRIVESRFDIDGSLDSLEVDRVALIKPRDGSPTYGTKAAKMAYSNLGVSDVSSVMGQTVTNTTSKSVSSGVLSYYCIAGEDANNILPVSNDILPSSSVPSGGSVLAEVLFDVPCLIIDFAFE